MTNEKRQPGNENHVSGKSVFQETRCLFCGDGLDEELYPARLYSDSFSEYSFSARRGGKREHYRLVRCKGCSLVRSNPVLDEDSLNELYAGSRFVFPDELPYAARTYAALFLRLARKYQARAGSLLEIGGSTGFFLESMMRNGYGDVAGFEPSVDCLEHAPANVRDRIINAPFDARLLGDRRFDAFCGFQIFDHLQDPLGVLSSVSGVLRPGGHALIVCHDVESWSVRLLGENTPVFDVEHIYLFSVRTARMLFERAGFEVLEAGGLSNTYPLGYWLRMLFGLGRLAQAAPKFLRNIPVGFRAGNLYVFGRKRDSGE